MRELSTEDYVKRRERKPKIIIATGFVVVVALSVLVTILASKI